jgi:phosphoglycolate phosphatase
MTLPRPTIVIFDMDGTTVRHVNPKLLHLLERLDDIIFKFYRFWGRVLRQGDKATIYKTFNKYKERKVPKLIVHRTIHRFRRKPVEQIVEPCPGIYAVLDLLQLHEIPTGLVSNGLGKGYGHDILDKFDLEKYYRTTIFREDITHSKPNPECIYLTLENMNIKATADDVIWYIGDRHKDIIAARTAEKNLPARVVPIAYGINAAIAVLEKAVGPDHILMSYYEMYAILDNLLKNAPPLDPSLRGASRRSNPEGSNPENGFPRRSSTSSQ